MGLFKSIFSATEKHNNSKNVNKASDAQLINWFYELSDYNSRLKVLNEISNPDVLIEIAESTWVTEPLRRAALRKLDNTELTVSFIQNTELTPSFRYSLIDLLPAGTISLDDVFHDQDELKKIASNWQSEMSALYDYAFQTIEDQQFLSNLFCTLKHPWVREAGILAKRLTEKDAIMYAYANGYYKYLLQDKIDDFKKELLPNMSPAALQKVMQEENFQVKAAAVDFIEDQTLLEKIAKEKESYTMAKDVELSRIMRAKAILKLNSKETLEALLADYRFDDDYDSRKPIKNALLKRLEELNENIPCNRTP